jgi:hypothetical protein
VEHILNLCAGIVPVIAGSQEFVIGGFNVADVGYDSQADGLLVQGLGRG